MNYKHIVTSGLIVGYTALASIGSLYGVAPKPIHAGTVLSGKNVVHQVETPQRERSQRQYRVREMTPEERREFRERLAQEYGTNRVQRVRQRRERREKRDGEYQTNRFQEVEGRDPMQRKQNRTRERRQEKQPELEKAVESKVLI